MGGDVFVKVIRLIILTNAHVTDLSTAEIPHNVLTHTQSGIWHGSIVDANACVYLNHI